MADLPDTPSKPRIIAILDALGAFRRASMELRSAQEAPMDDEFVGRLWLAMERKAQAEAKLWEAYDG